MNERDKILMIVIFLIFLSITDLLIIKSGNRTKKERKTIEKKCRNCKKSNVYWDGFTMTVYCRRPLLLGKVYVSGNGVCDKWKSNKPKGYREGEVR